VAAAPQATGAPADTSGTNTQEAGVDEPDIVKTDGKHLFVAGGGTVRAIDVGAAAPRVAGTLSVGGFGDELLLRGDRLLVVSRQDFAMPMPMPVARPAQADIATPPLGGARLVEIDVSDPSAMRVVRTMDVEGSIVGARMHRGTVRVAVSSYVASADDRISLGDVLPTATLRRGRGGRRRVRALTGCRDVRRPQSYAGLGMLTVLTIDMDKGLPAVDTDAIMADASTVYASNFNLYLTTQRWTGSPVTAVHRFEFTGERETTYRGSGTVRGSLLNQFSLSKRQGKLRVATTDVDESYVTVLDEGLRQIGQVGGLGRDERIYAVRFLGDRGYVVTFREVDPLYVVDLADPAKPLVRGELKIPGYSAYLHPIGDHRLLGIGQDASDDGFRRGSQISLFDVSDPAAPRRLDQRALGTDDSSEAEYDHHAFLWWAPERLAVLPLSRDAAGVRVDGDRLVDTGRIAQPGVRRAVVVKGRLYTVSSAGVRASRLDTLAELASVRFGE
jgi:uncharacterized secreted protein with C-terminal beta-propeller domain